jgi:hypothetical protein
MAKIIDVFRDLMRKHPKKRSAKNASSLCTSPFNALALRLGTGTLIAATTFFQLGLPLHYGPVRQTDRETRAHVGYVTSHQ